MKIGIIGGTFDPIHKGHVHIALSALREFKLDRVWFMPAGKPYFKAGTLVTSPGLRLEMTRAAVKEHADIFDICDIEINDTCRTYTADTLLKLRSSYPCDSFFYILGFDSLSMLNKWYRPDIILSNAVILCAARDPDSNQEEKTALEAEKLKRLFPEIVPDIRLIHTPWLDISSTMIRRLAAENRDISAYVDKEVLKIIEKNGLYRKI